MTRLFEPRVLGAGIIIEKAPTLDNHGVRKVDMESHAQIKTYQITDVTSVEIPLLTSDYIVQCFDAANSIIYPNNAREEETSLIVEFLAPQTGKIRVLFVGGKGGD
ncbi:hypothetical protein D3C80_535140 [compost metagenome]